MSILNIQLEEENSIISLEEIKNYLRIDFNNDDILLQNALNTATRQCELSISKSLNIKTYILSYFSNISQLVKLKFDPIISITKVIVIDNYNQHTQLNENEYNFDNINSTIKFKKQLINFYRVDIYYRAGFEKIPEDLKQGILYHIAKIYEDKSGYNPIPKSSNAIYKTYKQIKL